jgi:glutaconate CoA-transferase subunit B
MDGGKRFGVYSRMSCIPGDYTPDEMMTVAAARKFRDRATCFVGVGLPSVAACLARRLHAPEIVLVYESGAIGPKPTKPPLSIADQELADTAEFVVSVPEIFSYWLQGGHIEMGFLGTAQIDRFANLNSTVIGKYPSPKVRMPGAGGAPLIAAGTREIVVIVRQTTKSFVAELDFLTTARCVGSTTVITDLGVLESDAETRELTLLSCHAGVTVDRVREATAWPLKVVDHVSETPAPTWLELSALRELQ